MNDSGSPAVGLSLAAMATRRKSAAKKKARTSRKKTSRRAPSGSAELAELRDHIAAIEGTLGEIYAALPELARASDVALLTELLQEFPQQLSSASPVGEEPHPQPSSDSYWRASVAELAASTADAARSIHEAIDTLPRDPEYTRFASQLRELAIVSPSLLEWLGQVPQLTQPLAHSTSELRRAAGRLEAVSAKAEGLLADSGGSRSLPGRAAELQRELKDLDEELGGTGIPAEDVVTLRELGAAAARLTESVSAKPKARRKRK